MDPFDLSDVSSLHYRNQLRTAHWLTGGFFFVLIGVAVYRVAFFGLNSFELWMYGVLALLIGFLFYIAFLYARPGPTELRLEVRAITFVYRGGRRRIVATDTDRVPLRLVEQIDPEKPPRFEHPNDTHYFAAVRSDWIALTPEAHSALGRELEVRGFATKESMKPHPPTGTWRIQEFYRPPFTAPPGTPSS